MLNPPTLTDSFGSTSSSLLQRTQARDPQAWERLVELYSPLVYYWFRGTRLPAEDAADLMQEVFRSVSAGIGRFAHDSAQASFRGWLRTIAQNKFRDFLRKRQRTTPAGGGSDILAQLLDIPAPDSESDTGSKPAEEILVCQRALELVRSEFEPQTWDIFWRVTIDGHYPADIATELGLSTAAIYKAKSRVLSRLREQLGELL
jgi:RNA polymerase sigma-70 factor, ECF subfamily